MLEFIDKFPDLQETPAQFQERCGQIALKCFWKEARGRSPPDRGRVLLASSNDCRSAGRN